MKLTACQFLPHVESFSIGPDPTAVTAVLQPEALIEFVVWPTVQIREGYEMTTIITDDGRALSDYLSSEDVHSVDMRDLATRKIRESPV